MLPSLRSFLPSLLCTFLLFGSSLVARWTVSFQEPETLLAACEQQVEKLKADPNGPQYEISRLCKDRLIVVHPKGHKLDFYLPTMGGASTETIGLETAFNQVYDWLDESYMQPAEESAAAAFEARVATSDPLVLLILNDAEERRHFNVRYRGGLVLQDVVKRWIRPMGHESCVGVPCAYPGSCGDNLTCAWELHVPICELVNRGTAKLLEQRFGELPPAMTGFAEIVEVAVTGGHYAYRYWGNNGTLLEHEDRDGYRHEFSAVLARRCKKKAEREPFLTKVLGWEGRSYDSEMYPAAWGIAQSLLAHKKASGKGRKKRNIGDLLFQLGSSENTDAASLLSILQDYDAKIADTFAKPLPKKLAKPGANLLKG